MSAKKVTIVLVHGAWGDGSHWRNIIPGLYKKGYTVRSVQNPLTSLEDDIQKTKDLIDAQAGKVLLVGHSYGGSVISGAGHHDKVAGLVFIAAFAPDKGESLGGILARGEALPSAASIYPDSKGFLWIKYDKFHESFCADLAEDDALVMSVSQKPLHGSVFGTEAGEPAWKTKPSWYQVSDKDNMIPPATEKEMGERMKAKKIIHLNSSHAASASHPKEVLDLILEAANSFE